MEYYPSQKYIFVSHSTTSVITGTYCVSPTLKIFKLNDPFYPTGRYLKNDLFDQTKFCKSCKEPTESHITSYIHQQWKLTFNLRRIPSLKLEGKEEGKIWTWRRCLICDLIDGIPQATRRTVMSDDDEELSFGKFLKRAYNGTRNNLAPCGHSLHRDCVQYYGFGDMVIFLQHSSIKLFSVCLRSSILDFNASVAPLLSNAAADHDNEPTTAISYALNSKDYKDQIEEISHSSTSNQKPSHHVTISFEDDSPTVMGKTKKKFTVTCCFAQQFDALRKRCRIGELDFVHSLSYCSAMEGKTNNAAFFAKSFDERLIIKQISKIELKTFVEFAPKYFRYLIEECLGVGRPSCLTRILGVYQVTTHLKNEEYDNKEKSAMELMVMENIFFKRKISRIYSFKECMRYHDISKITDPNEALLDMNDSEEVHAIHFYLPDNRKITFLKALWYDSSFLHEIGVGEHILVVGVDEERETLVCGIFFDFKVDEHYEQLWIHLMKIYSSSCFLSRTKNDNSSSCFLSRTKNDNSPSSYYYKRLRSLVDKCFHGLPGAYT